MVYYEPFYNTQAVVLENETIKATVLPDKGGKVASLIYKPKNFELLFQNPKGTFGQACITSRFEDFEACGFDDAFPSIEKGVVRLGGREIRYPDHGEVWSAPLACEADSECIKLSFHSSILGYSYLKRLRLAKDGLECSYSILNQGEEPFPYIWAFHCLVNYEEDMHLLFPDGTAQVVNVMHSQRLGGAGSAYAFPCSADAKGEIYDFTRVPAAASKSCEKYYVLGRVSQGSCGYYYPSKQVTARIEYDQAKLPYLGFWITAGGFRGDYNCALEPATGFYDSIETAVENHAVSYLHPGETLNFDIRLSLF